MRLASREVIVMRGRKTTTAIAVIGGLVAFLGAFVILAGADNLTSSARDADGYIMFERSTFERPSAAIVIRDIDVLQGRFLGHAGDSGVPSWAIEALEVRIQGAAPDPEALFVGFAAGSAVDSYLDGVAHDEITELELDVERVRTVEYTPHEGASPPDVPGTETFWDASAEGPGLLTLDWTVPSEGEWTAVVMNADASAGVTADLVFGAQASNIEVIGWTKIAVGLVAFVVGGLAFFFGLRRLIRSSKPLQAGIPNEPSATEPLDPRPTTTR